MSPFAHVGASDDVLARLPLVRASSWDETFDFLHLFGEFDLLLFPYTELGVSLFDKSDALQDLIGAGIRLIDFLGPDLHVSQVLLERLLELYVAFDLLKNKFFLYRLLFG